MKWYRIDYRCGQSEAQYYLQANTRANARELFGSEYPIVKVTRCLPIRKKTQQQLTQSARQLTP